MIFAVNFAKLSSVHVCVNLCCANIGVPQKFLNGADVCSVLKHMGGEAVTEHMRRNALGGNPDCGGTLADDLKNALPRKRLTQARHKQMRLRRPPLHKMWTRLL